MSTRTIKHLRDQEAANSIAILKSGWLTKKGWFFVCIVCCGCGCG
jgi:hypothetical protein